MKTTSTLILLLFLCLFSFKLYAQDTITWTNLHNLARNNGTHGLRYDSASALGSTPESKYGVAASTSALFPSDTGSFWFTVDSVTKEHTLYGLAWNNYVFCDIPGNNYPDGDTGTFPSLVFYIDISGGYAHLYNQDTLVEYFPVTSGDVIKMSKEYVDFSHPTYGGLIQLYINGLPTTPYISFCEPCFGLTGWAMNVGVVVERNGGGIDPVQCSFGSMGAFGTHNYSVVWDTLINADVDTLTIRTDTSDIETGPFGGGVSANKLLDTLDGYVQYLAIEPDLSVAAFTAFGLMSFVNDADIGNINYFAISAGAYSIYENSGLVGYFGSAQPGDILAIYRTGGYFKWFLNGDSLYTSSYNMFDYDWPTGEPDYSMQAFSEMLYPGSLFDLMASFPSPLDTPVISSTISGYCSGYGEPFTLSVTNPLWPHYRWFKNGTAIANSDSVSHYESSPPSASATYRAMVYDNLGDTLLSDTLTITVGPIVLNSHITNIYPCHGGSNGIDSLFVSGGSGVNNYQWPSYNFSLSYHGSSHAFYPVTRDMALIDDLDTGVYTLNVTDYNGCTATKQDTVRQPDTLTVSITSSTNVSCYGGSNGTATATASGETAPYHYAWTSGAETATATGLVAGTYTVIAVDTNECAVITATVTITQPAALSVSITSSTNVSCHGGSNGAATVSASGGTAGYSYSWSSGATTSSVSGLSAGTYTVTVTDAHSCTATGTTTITQPSSILVDVTTYGEVSCYGGNNGSAAVSASGGTASYSYVWSPSGATNTAITTLAAATYTVTLTDGHSCTATGTTTITQPSALSVSITTSTNLSFNDSTNISATVTPNGGTSPYTYSWSPAGGTDSTAVGLMPETYSVTATDAHGCTATTTVTFATDSITVAGGIVSFSTSADSITVGDTLHISDLSSGFPSGTLYIFQYGTVCGVDTSGFPHPVFCIDTFYSAGTATQAVYIAPGSYAITLTTVLPATSTSPFRGAFTIGKIMRAKWEGFSLLSCFESSPTCNLIINGTFESEVYCPETPNYNGSYYIYKTDTGNYYQGYYENNAAGLSAVCGWQPALLTNDPSQWFDYYVTNNSCNPNTWISAPSGSINPLTGLTDLDPRYVPTNNMGSISAHTGGDSAYIGMACYEGPPATSTYSGFIYQKMSSPMDSGATYTINFWVAMAAHSYYAVNGFGARFSVNNESGVYSVQQLASLGGFNDTTVIDTTGWKQVTGTYIASGGEQYIYLGDFLSDGDPSFRADTIGGAYARRAYYYFDDISVIPELNITVNTIPACTSSSPGGIATLNITSGSGGYTYAWSNGETTNPVIGLDTGVYIVTVTDDIGCTGTATSRVTANGLDYVRIASDSTNIINDTTHVNKWEKYEIAFKLSPAYENAVDSFFAHYNHTTVDTATDLNPYADDSLNVQVNITSPTGAHYTKWAFFMRQGLWVEDTALGNYDSLYVLGNDTTSNALNNYNWHFRFAPDKDSTNAPWTFYIVVSAPHSSQATFMPDTFCGFQFICDPPLSDNHGFLKINTNNNRYYKFDDGTPFFGIGEDMPDQRHQYADNGNLDWQGFYKMDYNNYIKNFNDMYSSGGNYMRMWMYHWNFAVEKENLGVYDRYDSTASTCPDTADGENGRHGNRQWYLWSLDQIMNEARAKDIYIQMTVELDYPSAAGQNTGWGNDCYIRKYVYPTGTTGYGSGQFLHPEYFYVSNPVYRDTAGSAEYYWKRRYKYISSRWGYAVNLAAYESFNEVDQTLMYMEGAVTLSAGSGICTNAQVVYPADTVAAHIDMVQNAITDWHTDIGSYLKDSLGDRHLFTVSITGGATELYWEDTLYHEYPQYPSAGDRYERKADTLFYNPYIDMVDIHNYGDDIGMQGANRYDPHNVESRYWESNEWVHCDTCPADSGAADTYYLGLGINKPIHFGEGATNGDTLENDTLRQTNLWGNNYDLSFHNEIWATAMMGCNTTLLTWQWEIVHRWDGATMQNLGEALVLSNVRDTVPPYSPHLTIQDTVRTMYHNYKRLSQFVSLIDFNSTFIPYKYYNDAYDSIECYYLVQSDSSTAYGWVHNMNKYWKNAYYYQDQYNDSIKENYYGCERSMQPPDSFRLSGFKPNHAYYVQFAPTRLGNQTLPDSVIATTDSLGRLLIDLSTAPLGCDSMNADYAFTVGSSFIRRLRNPNGNPTPPTSLNFNVYPNPSKGLFNVILPLNDSVNVASLEVLDVIGKTIFKEDKIKTNQTIVDLSDKERGIYYVRLTLNNLIKVKKIILL